MDARATRRGVPAVVIWGGFGALAWAALTVLTGGGSAYADEANGPLDGLTSTVEETVTAVAAPVVNQVVAPVVTQVAAPVVQAVTAPVQQAAPPVVAAVAKPVTQAVAQVPVAAPVVQAVAPTVQAVVETGTDLLIDSPASHVVDPIMDAVTGLPIVGEVVEDLGTRDLVDSVVDVVDDVTGVIGGVVDATVPPIVDGIDPALPDPALPGTVLPVAGGSSDPGSSSSLTQLSATASGSSVYATVPALATQPVAPASIPTVVIGERGAPGASSDAPSGAPPGAPVSPTSSAGPGGGASSAFARLGDVGVDPLRAWDRVTGPSDDALPGSPVADTDNSPD
ncbi:hypothetical protein [Microbacterium sp. SA39]|uniref:hypothetical protein n=1 Tax=Microbacterium sp. SA39 TaxID=1263625 RepID=UPI00061E4835|nr:hypothetical protein [Microbacterium sp. SA39]KJQ52637.1 hypothetical protein RS85_03530 [Microbacterium sp. SA39]